MHCLPINVASHHDGGEISVYTHCTCASVRIIYFWIIHIHYYIVMRIATRMSDTHQLDIAIYRI